MKPLDFIVTKARNVGMITEVCDEDGHEAAVVFLNTFEGEKEAWWSEDEFEIIDSLPDLLSRKLASPFSEDSVQPFKLKVITKKEGTE